MKVSKDFILQEFIDPITYSELGDQSISKIDNKLIEIAQFIRDELKQPITINNWNSGGVYKESGLRNKNSKTGAKLSQHKLGKAIDVKSKNVTGLVWYNFVKKNAIKLYSLGVRRIEHYSLATTWLHIDTKEHNKKCIQVVDLKKVVEEIPC